MQVQKGDRVRVNLAPFIGSVKRNKEAIPCLVVAIDGSHVEIRTGHPYRELLLWVETTWIDLDEKNEKSAMTAETL